MLCFLWISDFPGPITWRWLGWVNRRTDICVLGRGVGNMGSQHPSDLCTFVSITSTTWRSFSSFMPGTRPRRGFQPHQPAFWGLDLVWNFVWGRPGVPPLLLEIMGLSLDGHVISLWVGNLSSHAYQLSYVEVHTQTVGSLVILFY